MKILNFAAIHGQVYGDFNQKIGVERFLITSQWGCLYCKGTKLQIASLKEVISRGDIEVFATRLLPGDWKSFNTDAMQNCTVKEAVTELVPYKIDREPILIATPDYFRDE